MEKPEILTFDACGAFLSLEMIVRLLDELKHSADSEAKLQFHFSFLTALPSAEMEQIVKKCECNFAFNSPTDKILYLVNGEIKGEIINFQL